MVSGVNGTATECVSLVCLWGDSGNYSFENKAKGRTVQLSHDKDKWTALKGKSEDENLSIS